MDGKRNPFNKYLILPFGRFGFKAVKKNFGLWTCFLFPIK